MDTKRRGVLRDSVKALRNTVAAANQLVPGCALVGLLIAAAVTYVSIQLQLMMAVVVLLVLVASILVYSSTRNYGEATLALAAGLLTAFTVEWTCGSFAAFVFAWVGLSLLALLLSSVRIAAEVDGLYSDAAIALAPSGHDEIHKQLKAIAKDTDIEMLGPVERAEVIRLFAFRKLSLESMPYALKAVEMLHTITRVHHVDVATFVTDVYKMFRSEPGPRYRQLLDVVYDHIRESPASPSEFIDAFKDSRHIVLSGTIDAEDYFVRLRSALEQGVHPSEVAEYLRDSNDTPHGD